MSNSNQKLKILYVLKILMEHTDECHPITTSGLIGMLKVYGINAERKSIYSDIECLQNFGVDVICEKGQSNKYYIGARDFELPELKLLVDSVQASKFMTLKKSMELIKKLEKLASKHDANALQRQVMVHKRIKSMNESIYYSVDAIHEAIKNRKIIEFKYYSYDINKNFKPRRNGSTYSVIPFALSWADENYYLVGYYDRYKGVSNFRVDRMDQVVVSEKEAEVISGYENFDVTGYTNKIFGMFGGTLERVKIRFEHDMINLVIDKFGKDISICEKDETSFCVYLNLAITNTFFSWIVIFGTHAEILSPAHVREEFNNYLEAICGKY
ncbi:MAG: WYL domain-containing protein [Clostridiales bacterium]|nr:WYL domain-containing protein [Clostridiales bacterium]